MKGILIFAVAAILALSLAAAASAKEQHQGILLNRIVLLEDRPSVASVAIENGNDFDFQGGKIVILIPELGIRASSKIDVSSGGREFERVVVEIPDAAPEGEYWVRITVTNEDVRRVRHRVITI